jgi:phage tail sheath protein FI
MPEYLHPGVYVEETSYRGKPIQGVSTSTAGFVGAAGKGPEGRATFIPSFAHFKRIFGEPAKTPTPQDLGSYLGHSVRAFFENGGSRCYVVRALAGDALASQTQIEQGIALKLAPGVTARGPTATLKLNALRGVEVGSVLRIFTRPDANTAFAQTRTATVDGYDAVRNTVTLAAADALPAGVALDPENTTILIQGIAPGNLAPGGGAGFTAINRGVDGDLVSVEIRPRDRPPVALTAASAARRDPVIALDPDPAEYPLTLGQTTLRFTAAALRLLRVGDEISVGGSSGRSVTGIADGDVEFDVVGGGAGGDFSGGGTIRLTERGGTVLDTPIELGTAPAAFAIDMTAGGPFGPTGLLHELAALLGVGDVVQVDDGGGVTTDVAISAAQVAEEIGSGQHVTIAAPGLTRAEAAAPVEAHITRAAAAGGLTRLFVGDASRLAAPQRAGSPEAVAIASGTDTDAGSVLLVDPATSTLFLAAAANPGDFPDLVDAASFTTIQSLGAVADGQTTIAVASTASFYTGAKVELDSGSAKFEGTIASVDPAARTVTLDSGVALGAGNFIDLPADAADRRVYLRTCEIDVLVYEDGVLKETFEGLTWNADANSAAGLRYYVARLNDEEAGSKLVRLTEAAATGLDFAHAPVIADGRPRKLGGGSNGSALTEMDLIGQDNGPNRRTGIKALSERDDISMVAVPGVTAETVQNELITHCELLKYRMAVLDAPPDALDVTALQTHRNNYDTKYAAYYAPWLRALNLSTGRIESFPPSAYAMGIYARTDNTVGVHKAPANEVVRNIVDVALPFTAAEQDVVNPVGINLIRDLTPRGIRVWGARTLSSDQEWKYVNIRRLFIYCEHSIDLGTQWVVFEPNSEALWAKVVETIKSFLFGVWKSGALMGTTPDQGYFVTCDRTTMTQDDIDNGRLVCEIGLAPVAPAEFVIFRIGQFTATVEG